MKRILEGLGDHGSWGIRCSAHVLHESPRMQPYCSVMTFLVSMTFSLTPPKDNLRRL